MVNTEIKVYNLKEVAEILKVTPRTIQRYLKAKKLKGVKIGGWKFSEDNIKEFLNNGRQ